MPAIKSLHTWLCLILITAASSVWATEPMGKVVSLSGHVSLSRVVNGVTTNYPLKAGQELYPKDVLKSENDSSAKVLMSDQTVMDLNPDSQFTVEEYELKTGADRKVELNLMYGKVRLSVNKKIGSGGVYHVKTKSMVMGVRGTEFIVASPAGGSAPPTQLTVLKGTVEAANPHTPTAPPIPVNPGSQLSLAVSASGQVVQQQIVQLSPTQLTQAAQSAVLKDNTFSKSVTLDAGAKSKSSAAAADAHAALNTNMAGRAPASETTVNGASLELAPGYFSSDANPGANFAMSQGQMVNVKVRFKP